jgi:uncharacterized membrane protein
MNLLLCGAAFSFFLSYFLSGHASIFLLSFLLLPPYFLHVLSVLFCFPAFFLSFLLSSLFCFHIFFPAFFLSAYSFPAYFLSSLLSFSAFLLSFLFLNCFSTFLSLKLQDTREIISGKTWQILLVQYLCSSLQESLPRPPPPFMSAISLYFSWGNLLVST